MSEHDTPVEAAKQTWGRTADTLLRLEAMQAQHTYRLSLLEQGDRLFKLLAVALMLVVVIVVAWNAFEFHRLIDVILLTHR